MKIYITQGNEPSGPFSKDELQSKIYSGEVPRDTLACPVGGADWVPLETLLKPDAALASPPVISSAPVGDLSKLRDPKERSSLVWLYIASVPAWILLVIFIATSYGGLLVIIGVVELLHLFGRLWFAAYVKTNAIRVSESQLPEVYYLARENCQKLGMEVPDVYVLNQNVWNSFATRIFGRRMVVLLSGAVDSILLKGDMKQLSWLIGHELGHHWAGHLNFSQKLANMGGWCIWLALWHSRRRELTCDRVGLYCAGSLKASQGAVVNSAVGAQLANRVNITEAMNQWQTHRDEFFVKYRTLYSTHPHLLARLAFLNEAAMELGIAA